MMPKPPTPRIGPTGPTNTKPKTMAERVGDIKGRMMSGSKELPGTYDPDRTGGNRLRGGPMDTGPVINRPVTPRTAPTELGGFDADRAYPGPRVRGGPTTAPVINRPVTPRTGPMPGPQVNRLPTKMASGGKASSRADGIAQRGKTKGKMC